MSIETMVLKVKRKGNKHRLVPLSFALRKALYRYVNPAKVSKVAKPNSTLTFGTRNNTSVTVRNIEHDFSLLGDRLKIEA